jgi:hypothetical protein
MAKHKEIKRWAAGAETWGMKIIVVQATLVESAKQFRVKEQKDGTLAATERQFSACVGYRKRWDKDAYPTVGYATRDGALRGYLDYLRKQQKQAETTLEEQMRDHSFVELT